MNDREHKTVRDVNGGCYPLGRQLGRGGQGAVYACQSNPRVAVKISNLFGGHQQAESLRQQLAVVKRFDLTGLPIARPIAMLAKPHVGYVMELITGMDSIATLFRPPLSAPSIRDWYVATGGLRRRLLVLQRLATILSQVHGKGLVYGDPSPGNVLVSQSNDGTAIFLIDSDNLRTSSRPDDAFLYTPGYGAPELIAQRSGINSLTDVHAFAVIAFQVLALCHPLIGDEVDDGDPSLEESALCGDLPWIDHPDSTQNRSSRGISRDLVLSPILSRLFERTFNEGLNDPTRRPGLVEWTDALMTAPAVTLTCSHCGWSYYYSLKRCPMCDTPRPRCLVARIGIWDPEISASGGWCTGPNKQPLIVGASVGTSEDPLTVTPDQLGESDSRTDGALLAGCEGNRIMLSSTIPGMTLSAASTLGKTIRSLTDTAQSYRLSDPLASLYIHTGDMKTAHRVVRLSFMAEASS